MHCERKNKKAIQEKGKKDYIKEWTGAFFKRTKLQRRSYRQWQEKYKGIQEKILE